MYYYHRDSNEMRWEEPGDEVPLTCAAVTNMTPSEELDRPPSSASASASVSLAAEVLEEMNRLLKIAKELEEQAGYPVEVPPFAFSRNTRGILRLR